MNDFLRLYEKPSDSAKIMLSTLISAWTGMLVIFNIQAYSVCVSFPAGQTFNIIYLIYLRFIYIFFHFTHISILYFLMFRHVHMR